MTQRFLMLLLVPCFVWGQINTESMRSAKQSDGLHLVVGADLGLYSGNTSYTNYKAKARLEHSGGPATGFLVSQYQLAETDEKEIIDKAFAHLRIISNSAGPNQVEIFIQYEYNHFIDLQRRQLAGIGMRSKLFNSKAVGKSLLLYLGIGAMLESEREHVLEEREIQLTVTTLSRTIHLNTKILFRSTNYLVLRAKFGDGLSATSTIYYQPDFDNFDDYRILWDAMLKVNLTKRLALTNTFNMRFDSLPPYSVKKKQDLELITGLIYEF
jgi:hypothetical protein